MRRPFMKSQEMFRGAQEDKGRGGEEVNGVFAQVLLRAVIVRRGCKQSGQLARVRQREWKKNQYDRGGTRKCSPRVYTLGYFLSPGPGRGSYRRKRK
jgi:hypothetical protein